MSNTYRHKCKARQKRRLEPYSTQRHFTKRHGSPIAKCNCAFCVYGAKRGGNPAMIRTLIRSHRHATKRILRKGEIEDLTTTIPVGYTD